MSDKMTSEQRLQMLRGQRGDWNPESDFIFLLSLCESQRMARGEESYRLNARLERLTAVLKAQICGDGHTSGCLRLECGGNEGCSKVCVVIREALKDSE